MGNARAKILFYFDTARICIGDFCIARNTGMMAFVYLLQAVGIPCTTTEENTVCVDNVTLFHNLHGKCYFRFTLSRGGQSVFDKVKFVINPELYPGLKEAPRAKQMKFLKDFIAVSLRDRLEALSAPDAGFSRIDDRIYESALVQVKDELDLYHAVITVSYKERPAEEEDPMLPEVRQLLVRIDELEHRVAAVEEENRELRKVNDVILELFGSLKPAHDLRRVQIPEDADRPEPSGPSDVPSDLPGRPRGGAADMSPEKRSRLINKYLSP